MGTVSPSRPFTAICLAGPTGAGKTGLAIRWAQTLNGEIINADSRQLYADFPIITAQPTEKEKGEIVHHLYGFLETEEKINAGKWARMAMERIREITLAGKLPIIVGGTGFYFNTILRGLAEIPETDLHIRAKVEQSILQRGSESMHLQLACIDPAYAAKIHPHDKNRIARGLEVFESTGKTLSWWHENSSQKPLCQGPLFVLDTSLAVLEPLLKERIDAMLAMGALEEAENAWTKCHNLKAPGWSGIGCAELGALLAGRITRDECLKLWLSNTRAYAKRQITWFRSRKETIWINLQDGEKIGHSLSGAGISGKSWLKNTV